MVVCDDARGRRKRREEVLKAEKVFGVEGNETV